MKKSIIIILVIALALLLCACTASGPVEADASENPEPTAEATEAPTAEPTAAPTEAPTPEPTEEPTPEPTAVPEPVEYAFDDVAEVVLDLPVGEGENDIHYTHDPDFGTFAPDWFVTHGDKLYIPEEWNTVAIFDMKTGELTRGQKTRGVLAAVTDDYYLIAPDGYMSPGLDTLLYYPETGECVNILSLKGDTLLERSIHSIFYRDGKCWAYIEEERKFEEAPTCGYHDLYLYELDVENKVWRGVKKIYEPRLTGEVDSWSGWHWNELVLTETGGVIDPHCGTLLGTDLEGNMYFMRREREEIDGKMIITKWIKKYSPQGVLLGYVELPFLYDDFPGENDAEVRMGEDGCVYVSKPLEDRFTIFRVSF